MGTSKILLIMAVALIPAFLPAIMEGQGNVAVDKYSNGEQVALRVGEYLEVRLEQAGATGYTWQVADLDEKLLNCIESGTTPTGTGKITGAPVLRTWRFKAVGKGQTELTMYNYRPWEGIKKAVDKFQVRVKIR